jgi:histidine ammonia-lyase
LVRARVAPLVADRSMTADIERIAEAVRQGEFDSVA